MIAVGEAGVEEVIEVDAVADATLSGVVMTKRVDLNATSVEKWVTFHANAHKEVETNASAAARKDTLDASAPTSPR